MRLGTHHFAPFMPNWTPCLIGSRKEAMYEQSISRTFRDWKRQFFSHFDKLAGEQRSRVVNKRCLKNHSARNITYFDIQPQLWRPDALQTEASFRRPRKLACSLERSGCGGGICRVVLKGLRVCSSHRTTLSFLQPRHRSCLTLERSISG